MRIATLTRFNETVDTLTRRQIDITRQQAQVSSGKRVSYGGDDPIAAASAERSLARMAELAADQRALDMQRASLSQSESTLGSSSELLQRFRELTVQAGSPAANAKDRTSIATEMRSLREQLFSLANARDANGVYLFSGLESSKVQGVVTAAFTSTGVEPNQQYQFNGVAGQNQANQNGVPYTLDGDALFMQVPRGNGSYDVQLGTNNSGQISTDIGQFTTTPAGGAMVNNYRINFSVTNTPAGDVTTYTVINPAAPTTTIASGTYQAGQPISFSDSSITPNANLTLTVNGKPKQGDQVNLSPYSTTNPATTNIFSLMDEAIRGIANTSSTAPGLAQTVSQALTRIDRGSDLLLAARTQAGIWLKRADNIEEDNKSMGDQMEQQRASAQDLDMVQGISGLQKMQTGYQAALQSYAQIQRLSLFDYIR